MVDSKTNPQSTKKLFLKLGTCSRTFFHLLNREFGNTNETAEKAADPLCGGLMVKGHQCGMLWGASLAAGAEAFRKCSDRDQAIGLAIAATQHLMESFSKRTSSVNCRDVTNSDFSSKWAMFKFFVFKARSCFNLADKWAPEAIESATEGLSQDQFEFTQPPKSCASEVAKKMGASDEEMVMAAGFAGGLGLSGNACGALSAAVWMNTLAFLREQDVKSAYPNPKATNTLKAFCSATDSEFSCSKISGHCFKTIDDHTEFIKNGGCEKLINVLAES